MGTKQSGSRFKLLSSSWHVISAFYNPMDYIQFSKVQEILFSFTESLLVFFFAWKNLCPEVLPKYGTHSLYKYFLLLDFLPSPASDLICKFMNRTSPRFVNWHLGTPPEVASSLRIFGNRFCRTVGQGQPHKHATIWNRCYLKLELR